jgi:hypothetical protein
MADPVRLRYPYSLHDRLMRMGSRAAWDGNPARETDDSRRIARTAERRVKAFRTQRDKGGQGFHLDSRPIRSQARLPLFSLFDSVEPIGSQIGPDFHFSVRPKDLNSIDVVFAAETKVNAKIILRKITSTA